MSEGSDDFDDEEVAEENNEDIEEKIPENSLTQEMIPECLSMLSRIGFGLAHAYVRMDCRDRELTDIDHLKNFIHVRFVDISGNAIRDLSPLNHLTHLITLNGDKNSFTTAMLDSHPYLQIVSLASNKITDAEGIEHPQLTRLNLNWNYIESATALNPTVLTNLHTLELRGNQLENTLGLNFPNLKYLYVAANALTKIEGLENLENLQLLHLRDNRIDVLDGFSDNMKNLQYINLRSNNVNSLKELKKLVCLPLLKAIVLNENPCTDADGYRTEVLIILRRLVRLDKENYTDDDRVDAEDTYNQRRHDETKDEEEEEND